MDNGLLWTLLPLMAALLDLLLGDPPGWPHPVRFLGKAAAELSPLVRTGGPGTQKAKGAAAALLLAGAAGGTAWFLAAVPWLGLVLALYLAYAGLALGQLLREGRAALGLLERGDLDGARRALAMLVTRDTGDMDAPALRRALAETLAENLNDAFAAPFLFLAVGGPAWLWIYKTVSTLDSMWGYRTEQWRHAGWFAARADDVLAFVPARVTAFALLAAGWLLRMDWRAAYGHLLEDARKTESPNAGWPMAAAAWLCGAAVGGPAVYFGQPKDKPVLGPAGSEWTDEKLGRLLTLCRAAGLLLAALAGLYALLLKLM
ncbi:MAG: adenosylcobinamide-phosphate synthase CbiB [Thermodesulfobacteriota bacterium]